MRPVAGARGLFSAGAGRRPRFGFAREFISKTLKSIPTLFGIFTLGNESRRFLPMPTDMEVALAVPAQPAESMKRAALGILAAGILPAHANLIVNGSFEDNGSNMFANYGSWQTYTVSFAYAGRPDAPAWDDAMVVNLNGVNTYFSAAPSVAGGALNRTTASFDFVSTGARPDFPASAYMKGPPESGGPFLVRPVFPIGGPVVLYRPTRPPPARARPPLRCRPRRCISAPRLPPLRSTAPLRSRNRRSTPSFP